MGVTVSPRPAVAWCLFAVAGVGLAGIACSGDSSSPSGSPRPTLTLPSPGPSPMLSSGTSLTAEQRELTEHILYEDATVRALADGSPMQLGQIGPYIVTAKDDSDILVGTTAKVTLTEPHDVTDMELPQATVRNYYGFWTDELQSRYSPWMDRTRVISVRNLSQFDVDVDLIRRRVVGVWIYSIDYLDQELTQPTPHTDPIFTGERKSKEAESIAMDDPAVSAVVDALDAKSRGSYAFEIGSHHFALVSAYADHLSSASGDWPIIIDQDAETGDYRSETIHVVENAANDVAVTVDLDIGKVINMATRERD